MNEHLYIKHFGPVVEVDIDITKFTVFIGDQGAGKSTIVKLYTQFRWFEKMLQQGTKTVAELTRYDRMRSIYLKYHRINNFVYDDTIVTYRSERYLFEYRNYKLNITGLKPDAYEIPKIMYVPAERTILSVIDGNIGKAKGLPDSLMTFANEFADARIKNADGYTLPFENLKFKYDKLNDISWIVGNGYKARLTESSSGIQSALPLCLVSEYLATMVLTSSEREMSANEGRAMQQKVSDIMASELSEKVKNAMLKNLDGFINYSGFVNIVEEIEMNMFPKSQTAVLRALIKDCNVKRENKLLLTTHSPYILSVINISLLAGMLSRNGEPWKNKANEMIDENTQIANGDVSVYALSTVEGDDYCKSILDSQTGMVSMNELDSASMLLGQEFQNLYKVYVGSRQ